MCEFWDYGSHSKVSRSRSDRTILTYYYLLSKTIHSYVTNPSTEPLVVFGKSGCGKSVLSAKVAQNIHSWLPSCSFIIRFTNLTPLSSDIVSIVGSIAEQVCYLTKSKSCLGPHVSYHQHLLCMSSSPQ